MNTKTKTNPAAKMQLLLKHSGMDAFGAPVGDVFQAEMNPEVTADPNTPEVTAYEIPKAKDTRLNKILQAYLNTDENKLRLGHWFVDGSDLFYRIATAVGGSVNLKENLVAKKIDQDGKTLIIGNSSVLGLIGRRVSYGHAQENRDETEVQRILSVLIPMIPFSVFDEAGLDLDQFHLIERGNSESLTRLRGTGKYKKNEDGTIAQDEDYERIEIMEPETVHFTGASLFRVQDKYFLFDIDRIEIENQIFNAFLVELPRACTTITEAYEMLKPDEVKAAEAKGLTVLRQGEFFFIPTDAKFEPTQRELRSYEREENGKTHENMPGILQAGDNSPNRSTLFHKESGHVSGTVTHDGREHAPLKLKGWYRAVPNTSTQSFTLRGDID
jgi:hypothetical protein